MNAPREVFMHRRLGDGWVTLCAYLDPDAMTTDVGVALCSPVDRFSRRIGRLIASGRRKKRPAFAVELQADKGSPMKQIETCFRVWLYSEFGDSVLGGDAWIADALAGIRRETIKGMQ
jgi:hypothetical protein